MMIEIKGMPEGATLVRVGPPEEQDFEIMNTLEGSYIAQGKRTGAPGAIIVQPSAGYKFVEVGLEPYDIREMKQGRKKFQPSKLLLDQNNQPTQVTVSRTVQFLVDNEIEMSQLIAKLDSLSEINGFIK